MLLGYMIFADCWKLGLFRSLRSFQRIESAINFWFKFVSSQINASVLIHQIFVTLLLMYSQRTCWIQGNSKGQWYTNIICDPSIIVHRYRRTQELSLYWVSIDCQISFLLVNSCAKKKSFVTLLFLNKCILECIHRKCYVHCIKPLIWIYPYQIDKLWLNTLFHPYWYSTDFHDPGEIVLHTVIIVIATCGTGSTWPILKS